MTATILVVDDLEPNIKLLEARLNREYYNVLTANSGIRALEILDTQQVDIVLLDVMMPVLDGIETCKRIKSNPNTSHIPVVMITALTELEDRLKGLEAGADEFLTKPVNEKAVLIRVKSLTRMKAIFDELKLRNSTNSELGLQENIIEKTDYKNSKILIIDDDLVQSKNLIKTLKEEFGTVNATSNTRNIDSILSQFTPDIILISCLIEDADPLRLCVEIKTKKSMQESPVILIAEEENMNIVAKGMDIGANDYFLSPIDSNEIIVRIKTQLRKKNYVEILKNNLLQNMNFAIKDGLTNIYNRRYIDTHIHSLCSSALETNKELSLMILDIDYFKEINDKYGHQAGDNVLQEFTSLIKPIIRVTDLLARYGGEEFAIIMPGNNIKEASIIAERIRKTVEEFEFNKNLKQNIHLTVSIGVTNFSQNIGVSEFVDKADKNLYKAKNSGRNKVISS